MITKTARLDTNLYDGFISFIDQLREDKLINRAQQSIFKDKLFHLFNIKNGMLDDVKFCDHFVNEYAMSNISFHPEFYIYGSGVRKESIPNLHIHFVGYEDRLEHKLLVSLSSNYHRELPVRYYVNDTCVSTMTVKNIKTIRILIKRLVGQKLYND